MSASLIGRLGSSAIQTVHGSGVDARRAARADCNVRPHHSSLSGRSIARCVWRQTVGTRKGCCLANRCSRSATLTADCILQAGATARRVGLAGRALWPYEPGKGGVRKSSRRPAALDLDQSEDRSPKHNYTSVRYWASEPMREAVMRNADYNRRSKLAAKVLVELSEKCRRRVRAAPNDAIILREIAKICRVKARQLNPTLKLSIASHCKH